MPQNNQWGAPTHMFICEEDLPELHHMWVPQLAVVDKLALNIPQHKVCSLQLLDGNLQASKVCPAGCDQRSVTIKV